MSQGIPLNDVRREGNVELPAEFERAPDMRTFTREECVSLVERILQLSRGGGDNVVSIRSWGNGELRWARNRISMASDRRDLFVEIRRTVNGGRGHAVTNQTDDASLAAAVLAAERLAARSPFASPRDMPVTLPKLPTPTPRLWSDATAGATPEMRGVSALFSAEQAEAHAMLAAGYTEARSTSIASFRWTDHHGTDQPDPGLAGHWRAQLRDDMQYVKLTQAQCSVTIRHPKGVGSGWAGLSGYEWTAIEGTRLAQQALTKCLASINPVRIEPGRYTTVLEAQAVNDLVTLILSQTVAHDAIERLDAEFGAGPFPLGEDRALGLVRTKLGLKVVDERISISHDPMDPLLGVAPEPGLTAVTWIDRGIFKSFNHSRQYALSTLGDNLGVPFRPAYRMSGGDTSIDEMIDTTQRGLLVLSLIHI